MLALLLWSLSTQVAMPPTQPESITLDARWSWSRAWLTGEQLKLAPRLLEEAASDADPRPGTPPGSPKGEPDLSRPPQLASPLEDAEREDKLVRELARLSAEHARLSAPETSMGWNVFGIVGGAVLTLGGAYAGVHFGIAASFDANSRNHSPGVWVGLASMILAVAAGVPILALNAHHVRTRHERRRVRDERVQEIERELRALEVESGGSDL